MAISACSTPEQRGRQLYAQHGCAVCHGPGGHADGPVVGRLDTPPRDFADPRAYPAGASPIDIARSIRRGAGVMPPFPDLTERQAGDIALWIVSLQRRSPASGGAP